MNPRNVEALAALLHEIVPPNTVGLGTVTLPKGPVGECDFCQDTARKLSAQGVLVPSALTDEELDRADDLATEMSNTTESGQKLHAFDMDRWFDGWRIGLGRIAKGEG